MGDLHYVIGPAELDKSPGFVRLVDVMPNEGSGITPDEAIVQAARVSYGKGTKTVNEDRGLVRYLLKNQHTTPFEMVQFKFQIRMPIFVYRQWFRHRSSEQGEFEITSTDEAARKFISMNEYSARYSIVPDIFYVPPALRGQSKTNKQGGEELLLGPEFEELRGSMKSIAIDDRHMYEELLTHGVSRELARLVLPVSYVTEFYMSLNLWNLLHMLKLRCDSHAQLEIRYFANWLAYEVKRLCPISYQAWLDYMFGAYTFSRGDIQMLHWLLAPPANYTTEDFNNAAKERGLNERETAELSKKVSGIVLTDPAALAETQPLL